MKVNGIKREKITDMQVVVVPELMIIQVQWEVAVAVVVARIMQSMRRRCKVQQRKKRGPLIIREC